MSTALFHVRAAMPQDVPAIVTLVTELAEFEHLTHLLQLDEERLQEHLFGPRPVVEALVATVRHNDSRNDRAEHGATGDVVAYALYFTNYSTFLAKPGLYLEDLYVQVSHRSKGIGKALLQSLARTAIERDYGRFEWTVLDWNANAIGFYEKMGASVMPEWRICRMTGDGLKRFAGPLSDAP